MMRQTILSIFDNIWPMLLIFTVMYLSIRIYHLREAKEEFIFHKEIMKLLFMLYIMILFYVVTFQDVSWSTSNFIPFKEMFRYQLGSPLFFRNVIGNMLMFIPFGFFISKYLSIYKTRWIFFFTFLASSTIEATQLVIGRVFDVDDILLNIIGGMIGYGIYRLCVYFHKKIPKWLQNETFYNILTIVFLIGVFYLWKLFMLVEL